MRTSVSFFDWLFGEKSTMDVPTRDGGVKKVSVTVQWLHEMERKYMKQAIEAARRCKSEPGRESPLVGAVVVKNGQVLAVAHRGQFDPGDHAEFCALEKVLGPETSLAGATVFTTLEPCTTRNHPKTPCAARLAERKISRVFVGMLDPNPSIQGYGIRYLRERNIAIVLFDSDLANEVEELNRRFTRSVHEEFETKGRGGKASIEGGTGGEGGAVAQGGGGGGAGLTRGGDGGEGGTRGGGGGGGGGGGLQGGDGGGGGEKAGGGGGGGGGPPGLLVLAEMAKTTGLTLPELAARLKIDLTDPTIQSGTRGGDGGDGAPGGGKGGKGGGGP